MFENRLLPCTLFKLYNLEDDFFLYTINEPGEYRERNKEKPIYLLC